MDTPKVITSYFERGFLSSFCVSFYPPAEGFGWNHPHQLHSLLDGWRHFLGDQKVAQRSN